MAETDTATPPNTGSERRRAPRVVAGRPGRMRFENQDTNVSIPCSVVDISQSGCRLTLSRSSLPRDWSWANGIGCSLRIQFRSNDEILIAAEVVWSQRTRSEFDILGLRFLNPAPQVAQAIDGFVLQRLHVGLQLEDRPLAPQAQTQLDALEVALEVEARPRGDEGTLYRLLAHGIGPDHLDCRPAPREGEPLNIPPAGTQVDLSVFPPTWARGERRTLRFAGEIEESGPAAVRVGFRAAGSDIMQMIRDLIPPKIERPKKPVEVDYTFILLIVAAIIIALIIAQLNG